jgi:hypothetical protein
LEIKTTAEHEKPGNAMDRVIASRYRYDLAKSFAVEIGGSTATVRGAIQHLTFSD